MRSIARGARRHRVAGGRLTPRREPPPPVAASPADLLAPPPGRWLRLKRRLAETLDVPAELLLDLPRVTLVGNLHLTVENHRGIIAFSDSRLVVGVARGEIEVRGRGLVVARAERSAVMVRGEIGELVLRPAAAGA